MSENKIIEFFRKNDDSNSQIQLDPPAFYPNGLISNVNYYFEETEEDTIIGKYNNTPSNLSTNKDSYFVLQSGEYQTLNNTNGLDGDVTDAFAKINEPSWLNSCFLPSELARRIYKNEEFFLDIPLNKCENYIFFPFVVENSWTLIVADVQNKKLFHFDQVKKELASNFEKFLQSNGFNSTNWDVVAHTQNRHNTTCGLYVMHLMDSLGKGLPLDENFEPNLYRTRVAEQLLEKSDDMKNICLYCFDEKIDDNKLHCKICKRFAHESCLKSNYEIEMNSFLINGDYFCERCKLYYNL